MNGLAKILFVLVGLIGMIGSAVFAGMAYQLGVFSDVVTEYQEKMWFSNVAIFVGILMFIIFFLFFFIGLLTKRNERSIVLPTKYGEIEITDRTIESTVMYVVVEENMLRNPVVSAKLFNRKKAVNVFVMGDAIQTSRLQTNGAELQSKIEEKLKDMLEIEMVEADIKIHKTNKREAKGSHARVI
ncbi:alkaline shock response membrane anchor protein AmaP [Listeria weihenstephanensis]|uniref:Alkaline shock response membrane anchor protein AmaP n=1 Tax=Listeria weihenstephanensis TaxID=1006155 RepID=A0A841Z386_9LIST|nr:alkaline shock response membrane anchor protein AmaP [Listeria weihenstephanensis]MBC1499152.1 alkaline shock response membrane anchor protein AmaP [Listeria weihenstephanensis]